MLAKTLGASGAFLLGTAAALANPIPLPVPASMPLEEMDIVIGSDRHVTFSGDFTFDFIPDGNCGGLPCLAVTEMLFPLPPVNASNVRVYQDGSPLPWFSSPLSYPTVLPEHPSLAMFGWSGPFPHHGAVFTVDYEHDLFARGDDWVFFYSLGTGKYFPTYDKITTALFDIHLPDGLRLEEILLDDLPVDPADYTLTGDRLNMTLTSEFGPFVRDLILTFSVPGPGTLWALGLGLACMMPLGNLRGGREASGR